VGQVYALFHHMTLGWLVVAAFNGCVAMSMAFLLDLADTIFITFTYSCSSVHHVDRPVTPPGLLGSSVQVYSCPSFTVLGPSVQHRTPASFMFTGPPFRYLVPWSCTHAWTVVWLHLLASWHMCHWHCCFHTRAGRPHFQVLFRPVNFQASENSLLVHASVAQSHSIDCVA